MVNQRDPHADNELIDRLQDEKTPSHQGRSGGDVNRKVGTRAELNRASDPEDTERATGSDNPEEDAKKGPKTQGKIQKDRNAS